MFHFWINIQAQEITSRYLQSCLSFSLQVMEDFDHTQLSKKLLQELQESNSFEPLLLRSERRLQASQPKGSTFRIMQWNTLAQGESLFAETLVGGASEPIVRFNDVGRSAAHRRY